MVQKDDFINVVFDYVRGIKPADLMHLVTAFAESEGDQDVKYEDFLHLINRNGEVEGIENQFRQLSMSKNDPMAGVRSSERSMRDVIERVKAGLSQATGGIAGIESAMRKIGSNGGHTVS